MVHNHTILEIGQTPQTPLAHTQECVQKKKHGFDYLI